MQSELAVLQKQYNFPGITCSYTLQDGTQETLSYGPADCEKGMPMHPQARMLGASIGNSFVASTIIKLAKENRLQLDDQLSKWIGDRSWFLRLPNHRSITLYHLLTHSSGISNHVQMPSFLHDYAKKWQFVPDFKPEILIDYILDQQPLLNQEKVLRIPTQDTFFLGFYRSMYKKQLR